MRGSCRRFREIEFSLFLAKNEKKQIPGEHHVRNDTLHIPQLLSRIELAMSYDDKNGPLQKAGPTSATPELA